jgi:hypothetical protein
MLGPRRQALEARMTFSFRPGIREHTPLIIGLAGPTKSGKSYSALRLATGLAGNAPIVLLNNEGPRGNQYADTFKYVVCDLDAPHRPQQYTEALKAAEAQRPGVIIIDSLSRMHDGPGGVLEWHEEILKERAGDDFRRREKLTFSAWIAPKQAENAFIYQMLSLRVPLILCIRAKEKAFIKKGQDPVFRWDTIMGDAIAFETMFTLMFLPGAKGIPDPEFSALRSPFDKLIDMRRQVDESLGQQLAVWAKGAAVAETNGEPPTDSELIATDFAARMDEATSVAEAKEWAGRWEVAKDKVQRAHWPIFDAARQRARTRLAGK